jgi:hypothetical protein
LFADSIRLVFEPAPNGFHEIEAFTSVKPLVGVSKSVTRSCAKLCSTSTRPVSASDCASSPPSMRSGGMRGTGPWSTISACT